MAQLFLKQDKSKLAKSSLEQALSHNFEIRESIHYHLINCSIHEHTGEYDECIKILESALNSPGVRSGNVPLGEKIFNWAPLILPQY